MMLQIVSSVSSSPQSDLSGSVLVDDAASKTGDLCIYSMCFSLNSKYLATSVKYKQIRIYLFHCVLRPINHHHLIGGALITTGELQFSVHMHLLFTMNMQQL